LKDSWEQIKNI